MGRTIPLAAVTSAAVLMAVALGGCNLWRPHCGGGLECPSDQACIANGQDARIPPVFAPVLDPEAQCWPRCEADGGCPDGLVCNRCLASGECPMCEVCVAACHPPR